MRHQVRMTPSTTRCSNKRTKHASPTCNHASLSSTTMMSTMEVPAATLSKLTGFNPSDLPAAWRLESNSPLCTLTGALASRAVTDLVTSSWNSGECSAKEKGSSTLPASKLQYLPPPTTWSAKMRQSSSWCGGSLRKLLHIPC